MSFTLSLTSCLNPAFKIFTCVLLTLWKGWSTQVFKYKKQGIMQTNMSGRILFIFNVRNQYLVLKRTFLMLLIGFIIWKIKWRVFFPPSNKCVRWKRLLLCFRWSRCPKEDQAVNTSWLVPCAWLPQNSWAVAGALECARGRASATIAGETSPAHLGSPEWDNPQSLNLKSTTYDSIHFQWWTIIVFY